MPGYCKKFDANQSIINTNGNNPTNAIYSSRTSSNAYNNQVENSDCLARNISTPTTSQPEMAVQLTRPTSRIALLVRQRRAMLEQLSCFICKGYLIDATTIDECMDSFCKSCIVKYLRNHYNCPKCGTTIHKTNRFNGIRPDKILQDIVYKLVPGLYDEEMKRRRDFYRTIGYAAPSSSEDDDSSSSLLNGSSVPRNEIYGYVAHPKPFYKPSDGIDLSIEPQTRGGLTTIYYDNKHQSIVTNFTGSLQRQGPRDAVTFSSVDSQNFKTFLRCPGKLTVIQLKKFIAAKFNTSRDDSIHLLYLNESLKDEYSLIDVAYIYDWRGVEHMRLFYMIERNLSNMTVSVESSSNRQLRPSTKTVLQGVGAPGPPLKRVCIDPKPTFYEEKNNNIIPSETRLRATRSSQIDGSSNRLSHNQLNQTSSSRLPFASRDVASDTKTRPISMNGLKDRQVASGQTKQGILINSFERASLAVEESPMRSETKELRSLRSNQPGAAKINISLSALNKTARNEIDDPSNKLNGQRGNDSNQSTKNFAESSGNASKQLVSYPKRGVVTPNVTGTTQSSLVTLASFTGSKNNHILTMSSSSATASTISGSYRNLISTTSSIPMTRLDHKELTKSVDTSRAQSTPQLAFSFVTERGITIVRRLSNKSESTYGSQSSIPGVVVSKPNNIPALPPPSSSSTAQQASQPKIQTRPDTTAQSTSPQRSQTNRSSDEGGSSRHHTKVKPIYKTFVDPTKLKSPNFKKLGYTARH